MGDWRNNPVNYGLPQSQGSWYDNPMAQDMLIEQKLIGMNVPPDQIPAMMAQIKMAEGLKDKIAAANDLSGIMAAETANPTPSQGIVPQAASAPVAAPQISDGGAPAAIASPSSPPAAGAASIYDRLGPEGLQQILAMGGIDEQREQAQYLRNKEGPTGIGGVGRMNTYVAASPLSHLASGVEKYRAKKDLKRLRDEENAANQTIIDILRNKKQEPVYGSGRVM
jgi:hypothetical protein